MAGRVVGMAVPIYGSIGRQGNSFCGLMPAQERQTRKRDTAESAVQFSLAKWALGSTRSLGNRATLWESLNSD